MASVETTEPETTPTTAATEDMELVQSENPQPDPKDAAEDATAKREREDDETENGVASKKLKVDEEKSVEEARMENLEEETENGAEEKEEEVKKKVELGPKTFESSVAMFDYFYKLLHHWPTNINVNKYEHLVLLELIKKGHPEPEKKIGSGISAFEIRQHPEWKSRCFFVVRADDSAEDFSFRKCVDHILPLPENMKIKSDVNKALGGGGGKRGGGGGGGRGGGRGRGRGRGGKFRK